MSGNDAMSETVQHGAWLFDAVDLFAGPGGFDQGARNLGLRTVGIEYDRAACETRAAAGHATIRADVARYIPALFLGILGLIGSPPCPTFSAAGKGAGTRVLHILEQAIRDEFAGLRNLARHTRTMARLLRSERLRTTKDTKAEASAWAWRQARMSALVVQPARWMLAMEPRWMALEQVPPVLPLWKVYAEELKARGFSVWCGVINCADYGVPQTRKRAILTASLDRRVEVPEPTHAQTPVASLWGEPERWISMAEALGWGMTERPMPTVTGGGIAAGGPEPIARGGRALLEKERGGGVVVEAYRRTRGEGMNARHGDRPDTPVTDPAPTMTSKARSDVWVVDRRQNSRAAGGGSVPVALVPMSEPAPTLTGKSGHQWVLRPGLTDSQPNRTYDIDEPAPTMAFGHDAASWAWERPATTIVASFRPDIVASFRPDIVAAPGWRRPGDGPRQHADGSLRITVQEAGILQSFPPDYPWQGSRSKQFEQAGNAFPPLAAEHVLRSVAPLTERAIPNPDEGGQVPPSGREVQR